MGRWSLGVLVSLVSGCVSEIEPRASAAAAACGISEPVPWTAAAFVPSEIEPSCTRILAEDFGIPLDSPSADSARGSAVAGAHALLAWEWGVGVDTSSPLEETLTEIAEITGEAQVGWLAYDYAAARIRRIEEASLAEGVTARWRGLTRTVEWDEAVPAPTAAGVLVHEARHGDGERHVDCSVGEGACDADATGAYGYEAALLRRAADEAEGVAQVTLMALADDLESRILEGEPHSDGS